MEESGSLALCICRQVSEEFSQIRILPIGNNRSLDLKDYRIRISLRQSMDNDTDPQPCVGKLVELTHPDHWPPKIIA